MLWFRHSVIRMKNPSLYFSYSLIGPSGEITHGIKRTFYILKDLYCILRSFQEYIEFNERKEYQSSSLLLCLFSLDNVINIGNAFLNRSSYIRNNFETQILLQLTRRTEALSDRPLLLNMIVSSWDNSSSSIWKRLINLIWSMRAFITSPRSQLADTDHIRAWKLNLYFCIIISRTGKRLFKMKGWRLEYFIPAHAPPHHPLSRSSSFTVPAERWSVSLPPPFPVNLKCLKFSTFLLSLRLYYPYFQLYTLSCSLRAFFDCRTELRALVRRRISGFLLRADSFKGSVFNILLLLLCGWWSGWKRWSIEVAKPNMRLIRNWVCTGNNSCPYLSTISCQ